MPLDDLARAAISEMVRRHGPEIADEPARCEGYLRDRCGALALERNLLVGAAKDRVPQLLLSRSGGASLGIQVAQLTREMALRHGISESYARWAVEGWATALGIQLNSLTRGPDAAIESPAEGQYRGAVRLALVDGKITNAERAGLDSLKATLLLSTAQADAIIAEVTKETRAALPPGTGATKAVVRVLFLVIVAAAAIGVWFAWPIIRDRFIATQSATAQPSTKPSRMTTKPVEGPATSSSDEVVKPGPAADEVGLASQMKADVDRISSRMDEAKKLQEDLIARRANISEDLPALNNLLARLKQAISHAEAENRWPIFVFGEYTYDAAKAAAVRDALAKEIAKRQAAIASLDRADAVMKDAFSKSDVALSRVKNLQDNASARSGLDFANRQKMLSTADEVAAQAIEVWNKSDPATHPKTMTPTPAATLLK